MSAVAILHTLAALSALVLGAWQLAGRKAGARHRHLGQAWVGAMAVAAVSSFWLRGSHGLAWLGGLSPIHGLSVLALLSLAMSVRFALRRDFARHRRWVVGAYAGLAGAGVFAVALPGRAMHTLLFVSLPGLLAEGWGRVSALLG